MNTKTKINKLKEALNQPTKHGESEYSKLYNQIMESGIRDLFGRVEEYSNAVTMRVHDLSKDDLQILLKIVGNKYRIHISGDVNMVLVDIRR